MTVDRTTRLSEIGAVLAERMPSVLDAAIALLESLPPVLDPARPDRYEITRQIGAGGQAEVLLATVRGTEGFHRLVAVKRVRAGQVNAAKAVVDLINEAHVTSRLSHPNVVGVLDVDHDKAGQPFLVMEYVDGVDLEKLIETGPVPHPIVIFIVRELLSGLGYIHEPGTRAVAACAAGWFTVTSRQATCCSRGKAGSSSPISAWPRCSRGPGPRLRWRPWASAATCRPSR